MTIEERIKEIEEWLDKPSKGGWITVSKWEQAKQDIIFLLSELKRSRVALEKIVNTSDWSCHCQHIDSCNHADFAAKDCGSIAYKALHPEGVK